MATPGTAPTLSLAILDDYQDIAFTHFNHITPERLQISKFPTTLNPKYEDQKANLIERLRPFTIVSTMRERTPFPADVLAQLPNLKLLLTTGMRNASIAVSNAKKLGVIVAGTVNPERLDSTGIPSPDSTTEHTWALILGLAKNIARDDKHVKAGGWQVGFNTGLAGKTLGVLGFGRLGSAVARIAIVAFGMKVAAWSSSLSQEVADEKSKVLGLPAGSVEVVGSKQELFERADVLSVHYVLSDRSIGIVGEKELRAMKRDSLLINTSRGLLVDEKSLLKVLQEGCIRGAALDVFSEEPLPPNHELRTTQWGQNGKSEVLITPHMGYVEENVMHNWYEQQAQNVERWIKGQEILHIFE